jgi:outer membrane protein TolC
MNFIRRTALLATSLALTAGGLVALEPSAGIDDSTSLEETLAFAQANNAAIRAADRRWQAAIQRVPQAKGWPDPRLNYGYFVESVETRVGPQEHRIGVMQPLPWFGKLKAAGDVASSEAAAALAELTSVQLQVAQVVKDVWFELAWLDEARRITGDNIELVRQLEGVAQTRFKAGGSLDGVTKAQVELGKLEDRLASFDDLRRPLQAQLNAVLNRPADAPVPTPSLPSNEEHPLPPISDLYQWQREANPMLRQLGERIVREERAGQLARKQGMPEFGLGLDYIVTGDARMPGVPDSGQDAAIAMFSVNIPLWRGKYRAAVAEAEARRAAAEAALEDQTNELRSRLRMAIYRHRDAERKINLYGATLLPQARSALSVAQQSYETGKGDFLNLIDAQRALLEFELEQQRALANREQALAGIELLVGRNLPQP